jgi:hypothetical protein
MEIANKLGNLDLAIRWSDKPSALARVQASGLIPLHGLPKHFRCHRGYVVLIGRDNKVKMTLRSVAIDGPMPVVLADGKKLAGGYVITADKRTIKIPRRTVPSPVAAFPAIGAFKYFDHQTGTPVLVGPRRNWSWKYAQEPNSPSSRISFRPHVHGIPGRPRNHPESTLVDQYVSFVGDSFKFGHNYLREPKLFVDLFDLTHWQLIEAKANTSRESIRMAIGQLRDYCRFYQTRHPSLAALLPERPTRSCMLLLTANRIAVIWKSGKSSFKVLPWQVK